MGVWMAGINLVLLYNSINLTWWIVQLMSLLLVTTGDSSSVSSKYFGKLWAHYFFLNYTWVILSDCFRDSWSPSSLMCQGNTLSSLWGTTSLLMIHGKVGGCQLRGRAQLWKHYDDSAASFTPQITHDISFKTEGAIKEEIPGNSSSDKYTGQAL